MGMLPAHATLESITASASFGHRFYTGIEMLNRLLEERRKNGAMLNTSAVK